MVIGSFFLFGDKVLLWNLFLIFLPKHPERWIDRLNPTKLTKEGKAGDWELVISLSSSLSNKMRGCLRKGSNCNIENGNSYGAKAEWEGGSYMPHEAQESSDLGLALTIILLL